jgi:hypothetical protein
MPEIGDDYFRLVEPVVDMLIILDVPPHCLTLESA